MCNQWKDLMNVESTNLKVIPDKLKGRTIEDVAITTNAVVIKFTDGTF